MNAIKEQISFFYIFVFMNVLLCFCSERLVISAEHLFFLNQVHPKKIDTVEGGQRSISRSSLLHDFEELAAAREEEEDFLNAVLRLPFPAAAGDDLRNWWEQAEKLSETLDERLGNLGSSLDTEQDSPSVFGQVFYFIFYKEILPEFSHKYVKEPLERVSQMLVAKLFYDQRLEDLKRIFKKERMRLFNLRESVLQN